MKTERKIFDKPKGASGLQGTFYLSLVILLIVDFFVHRHAHLHWEDVPEFFAAYGFICCVVLILVARLLRVFIKRDEKYYE